MVYLNTMTAILAKEVYEKVPNAQILMMVADNNALQKYIKLLKLTGESVKNLTNGFRYQSCNNSVIDMYTFTGAILGKRYDFVLVDTNIDRLDIEYCIKPMENYAGIKMC